MLPPSMSLPVMCEIACVSMASLNRYLHSFWTRAGRVEGFHDELNGHVFDLERVWLCQAVSCTWVTMTTNSQTILDWLLPGLTRIMPSVAHYDNSVKHATGAPFKIRGRDSITIGTWNTRTLRAAGKFQELTHEMDRFMCNILWLCKMRWKDCGKRTTEERCKIFFCWKIG